MNITGFWDVMTWEPRDSTTSLPLCFHSWLCDVTGNFFSQLCCSYSLPTFILHAVYIHI